MTFQRRTLPTGLDGVVAAETALSHVDGEKGELIIAGEKVGQLAEATSFEAIIGRLWTLATECRVSESDVTSLLAEARRRAFGKVPQILAASAGLSPTDGLRAGLACLQSEPDLPDHATILGAIPVIVSAMVARSEGRTPPPPNNRRGHAADTLAMLHGETPTPAQAKALAAYFITVCDHGMNASTFAARVIASTKADLFSAVTGGYCALTGPLHGGAPEPVLAMLDAIGSPERIEPWIDGALSRGDRLMGFGHRIYRVRDPRADVLRAVVERLGTHGVRLPFAAEVEAYARQALRRKKPDHPIETNVEFFTAILLDALKIPRQAFTPIFAAARAAGWTAHAHEQQRRGRLLRPSSAYIGASPAEDGLRAATAVASTIAIPPRSAV